MKICSKRIQTDWLQARQLGLISGRGMDFSLCHYVQISAGAHLASHPMDTRGSFPAVKQPECEADHSPPSSAEVKNVGSYSSTPPYVFMA